MHTLQMILLQLYRTVFSNASFPHYHHLSLISVNLRSFLVGITLNDIEPEAETIQTNQEQEQQ